MAVWVAILGGIRHACLGAVGLRFYQIRRRQRYLTGAIGFGRWVPPFIIGIMPPLIIGIMPGCIIIGI
jgi:hypothetical protein